MSIKKSDIKSLSKKFQKPVIPFAILITVVIVGTVGYMFLWRNQPNSDFIDALYMTFMTISTIGFAEIHPLNDGGRIFTIIIGFLGLGSLFYVLGNTMENLFILQLNNIRGKRKMQQIIDKLENHIILVGFGRVGKLAAQELNKSKKKFVIIDDNIELETLTEEMPGALLVKGDATNDDSLIKAGIQKAKGMIVTTSNSATTVFVIISAKVLNPSLFVVARTDSNDAEEKLIRAGADKVVNPYSIGGQRLANIMIYPNVVEFFETNFTKSGHNLRIEKIELPENSLWFDKTLADINLRQKSGVTILAVIRGENPTVNPNGSFKLQFADQLLVLGNKDQLQSLYHLIALEKN
jgi:voltage-gated potassium channel